MRSRSLACQDSLAPLVQPLSTSTNAPPAPTVTSRMALRTLLTLLNASLAQKVSHALKAPTR